MNKCILIIFFIVIIITIIITISNTNKISNKISNTFNKNNGIIYLENIFDPSIFKQIKMECKNLNKNLKKDYLINGKRFGTYIKNGYIYNILHNIKFNNLINNIVNNNCIMSTFPIEYRLYPKGSNGMKWHSDTLLFDKPQYECVYTIENTSDSKTQYKNNNKTISLKTKPNSLLIVIANGPLHNVTPINVGYRTILKFIFQNTNANPIKKMINYDINCRYNKCNSI